MFAIGKLFIRNPIFIDVYIQEIWVKKKKKSTKPGFEFFKYGRIKNFQNYYTYRMIGMIFRFSGRDLAIAFSSNSLWAPKINIINPFPRLSSLFGVKPFGFPRLLYWLLSIYLFDSGSKGYETRILRSRDYQSQSSYQRTDGDSMYEIWNPF